MTPEPFRGKEEALKLLGEKMQQGTPHGLHPSRFTPRLLCSDYLRMGGRVVDRARLESVFTFIGNEGSNPSPSGLLAKRARRQGKT
jgi:hypothetical protein